MSPNAPAFKAVPQDSDLIMFVQANEAMKDMLAKLNVSPEQAMKMTKLRLKLVEAYMKIMGEQETARKAAEAAKRAEEEAAEAIRLAEAEDALLDAIDTDILGITPEQKQQQAVEAWVLAFGKGATANLPVPVTDNNGNVHFCALPVPCCDKKQPVKVGAILNGELYGLCPNALAVYKAVVQQIGRNDRLWYYMNLREAKRVLQERNQISAINSWIYSFIWDKVQDLPTKRLDSQKNWLCGLPESVPCCDHAQSAVRYAVYNGVIYGLCKKAADCYWQCLNDGGSKKLQTTSSPQKLEHVVVAQAKDAALTNWVDAFVAGVDYESPAVLMAEDGHSYLCGLPESVGCCSHTEVVDAFPTIDGTVYGICKKAAWAFREGRNRHNDPDCLKYAREIGVAEFIAEQWRLRNTFSVPFNTGKQPANTGTSKKVDSKKARRERDQATRSEMKGQKRNDDSNIKKGKK